MSSASRRTLRQALVLRAGIVAAFSVATAVFVAVRASPEAQPALAPLMFALAAALALWLVDRRGGRSAPSVTARWARLGVILMGASTVLGVANTWYAFLDPARNGWFSGMFLVGSAAAMLAFAWLGDLDGGSVEP